jgi:hypothetical protein
VYRSQQRSTDLCTDFYIYHTCVCFCGGYELWPFWIFLAPPTILYERTLRHPHEWTIYVLSRLGWLSIFCYTVGCRTVIITINLSWLCCIPYRVFPVRRLYSCLLYSGSRTRLYLYIIMCTVQCCLLAYKRSWNDQFRTYLCYVHIF